MGPMDAMQAMGSSAGSARCTARLGLGVTVANFFSGFYSLEMKSSRKFQEFSLFFKSQNSMKTLVKHVLDVSNNL